MATVCLVVLLLLYPVVAGDLYWSQVMLISGLYLLTATGLAILRSEAGQISFGHGAIFGGGAYGTAMAFGLADMPFFLAAIVGFLVGMVIGVIISLPSFRVQGYYLGFVTLAGAMAFPELLFVFDDQTAATSGIGAVVPSMNEPVLGIFNLLTIVVCISVVAAVVLFAVIRSSRFGRQMRVVGESPEAAVTLGLSPGRLRMSGFAISSVMASLAGVLYVPVVQYVNPDSFRIDLSILVYFIVVVGGSGSLLGPLIGVALMYVLPNAALASVQGEYRLMIYGAIAFAVMFLLPEGVARGLYDLVDRVRPRKTANEPVSLNFVAMAASSSPAEAGSDVSAPAGTSASPILKVSNLSKRFGSVSAIDDVSFEVARGSIHGIVGPNGSGKTTLLNSLSDLIKLDAGVVVFDDKDVTSVSSTQRARLGMGRTFQAPRIFSDMSVWENLDVGYVTGQGGAWLETALESVRDEWDKSSAGDLPHAQQRLVELVRVLRQGSSLLILDEPAAGLSKTERKDFGELLRAVSRLSGSTIVIVEHDLELVWSIADRISVVNNGQIKHTGTPAELRGNDSVSHLFVGGANA